jgi:hypothetical protein
MGIDTLVEDIYNLVSTKEVGDHIDLDDAIENFGENIKGLMRKEFGVLKGRDSRKLRLSAVGRTDKYLWNAYNETGKEEIAPHTYVKFLYGHVIEELLLFLTKAAGHEVTCEQKTCHVAGVRGSMDCKIDGIVTDVKSASVFGFKKFKDGTLAQDDPFGYIGQIKAYAHSEKATKYGWLAMDKQNGHLAYLMYDEEDKDHPMFKYLDYDIVERVEHIKKLVAGPEPTSFCYPTIPDGKSGNMKLSVGCSYCQFKEHCYPNLRTFSYSYGPKFLTKVVKEPRVQEALSDEF